MENPDCEQHLGSYGAAACVAGQDRCHSNLDGPEFGKRAPAEYYLVSIFALPRRSQSLINVLLDICARELYSAVFNVEEMFMSHLPKHSV